MDTNANPTNPTNPTEASDTPADEWRATLDGGHAGETTLDGALSLDEAWQEALDWARSCDWDAEGPEAGHEVRALLTVSRSHPEEEERQRDVVVQDAETSEEVPPCVDGEDHERANEAHAELARLYRVHILGGAGLPEHWYGEGDSPLSQ